MKKLIFLGTSSGISIFEEAAEAMGYEVYGVMDGDYTKGDEYWGIPVINSETVFDNPKLAQYYKQNFVFFNAINWLPMNDKISVRNTQKRHKFMQLIQQHNLECINIIEEGSYVSTKSTKLGTNIYLGHWIAIEPHCVVEDFVSLFGHTFLGHHTQVGENSQIQRHGEMYGNVRLGKNSYVGTHAGIVQDCVVGDNVWIQPGIRVCRNVENNEIIGATKKSLRKTVPYYGTFP
jgi:UDP-3-O-[3-hydroxymyristoyl] glucosamine N-acyltransferase